MGNDLCDSKISLLVGLGDCNYITLYEGQNPTVNCIFKRKREVWERNGGVLDPPQIHLNSTGNNSWANSGRQHSSPRIILLCSYPSKWKGAKWCGDGLRVSTQVPCFWGAEHFISWLSKEKEPWRLLGLGEQLLNHSKGHLQQGESLRNTDLGNKVTK